MQTVAVRGLVKSFGNNAVLRGVNFSVERGEVVVIMGPSGSGKTTLLRSLNFLEVPDAGSVSVCGIDVACSGEARLTRDDQSRIKAIRQRSAMVFQSFNLFPHRTALENVIEGLVSVRKMKKPEAVERGMRLLERVGLSSKAKAYPAQLSGGQKQRVAIARGLAMEPEVILFDEPTSALDPALREDVLAVMRELANDGMTMLIVTHEVRFARDVADRVVFMDGGVVIEDADPNVFFSGAGNPRVRQFLHLIEA
ncbi:ectoine/hydroxyectoine ABC transporter ATP-binding protein EhuA [Burkholderia multivorans]|uniref:Ectoine/hydroxyectoine ABC transporter ATP-binding protein EhuA n=1 Tax=Burkholderia multivorans TaxID=87883 RepID=A0AB37APM4_9BURK|nr:ectoine/hydroxyectoine ABC transporter ATP-binding protein EhuA [Burkholderia multivorans]PRE52212.1 ectoine/hydroxyectoine ABC transporter ATP-binding protein EhuA [Burkholderia multivorans]